MEEPVPKEIKAQTFWGSDLSVWDFYRLNDAFSSLKKKGFLKDSNRDLNKKINTCVTCSIVVGNSWAVGLEF